MTEYQTGKYVFTVKEGEGDFSIGLEPRGGQPPHLKGCYVRFYLPEVTTVDGAQEVASYLNENLGDLILIPPSPPRHRERAARLPRARELRSLCQIMKTTIVPLCQTMQLRSD